MRRLLDRLRPAPPAAVPMDPPRPGRPLAVIGDVHGRDDLLGRLLNRLGREEPHRLVVMVGDLIDRGEDSAGVLRRLRARPDIVALGGNHEAMLLDFLEDPGPQGPGWIRNGGLQTLASFGIGGLGVAPGAEALRDAAWRLSEALGPEGRAWLRARPLWLVSGNVAVVHAAADPALPFEAQARDTLLWGHPHFGKRPRADGLWVAYGHVVRAEPSARDGRIATDTGAFGTGRLTAALIDDGAVRFIEA